MGPNVSQKNEKDGLAGMVLVETELNPRDRPLPRRAIFQPAGIALR
jgi:hypothetical protein